MFYSCSNSFFIFAYKMRICNVESKLKNLSLPDALFALEAALSFFRNIDFRVLSRVMHQIIE